MGNRFLPGLKIKLNIPTVAMVCFVFFMYFALALTSSFWNMYRIQTMMLKSEDDPSVMQNFHLNWFIQIGFWNLIYVEGVFILSAVLFMLYRYNRLSEEMSERASQVEALKVLGTLPYV